MINTTRKYLTGAACLGIMVLLLSCAPWPVEGELTLLVDDLDNGSWFTVSLCFSHDGSKVYYLSLGPDYDPDYFQIWSVDILDKTVNREIDYGYEILWMDVSHNRSICLMVCDIEYDDFFLYDLETSRFTDTIQFSGLSPKFSLETDSIIYSLSTSGIWKINVNDESEEIVCSRGTGSAYAPGPGDTLFAVGDSVFNINTGEAIHILVSEEEVYSMNWNPAKDDELLIATGLERDLFIFNIASRDLYRLDLGDANHTIIRDANFSPDGEKIVFYSTLGGWHSKDKVWLFEPYDK